MKVRTIRTLVAVIAIVMIAIGYWLALTTPIPYDEPAFDQRAEQYVVIQGCAVSG